MEYAEIGNLVDEPSSNLLCRSWICPVQVEEHIGVLHNVKEYWSSLPVDLIDLFQAACNRESESSDC
ncbi:hypothetical protein RHGRI_028117 [Rhododendron griersonianum]|uniref:Uncharacterized protein n=1 Tax=Rhododendron griersonianum TaxID=479676 RepID=A0AAV6IHS1_9ERIC|nr:hypothetical protein RHGRI_028117 [Rhododendron griersonianum]